MINILWEAEALTAAMTTNREECLLPLPLGTKVNTNKVETSGQDMATATNAVMIEKYTFPVVVPEVVPFLSMA